jgi:hypothetical protein
MPVKHPEIHIESEEFGSGELFLDLNGLFHTGNATDFRTVEIPYFLVTGADAMDKSNAIRYFFPGSCNWLPASEYPLKISGGDHIFIDAVAIFLFFLASNRSNPVASRMASQANVSPDCRRV